MMLFATLLFATQLDACHVLSTEGVAAVQGEAFTKTTLTTRGGFTTCFYQLPTFSKSVSVDVMRRGARKYWRKNFENEREREEPGEKESEPRKVKGIGSEALWIGARGTGSLLVRKGDAMVRVSVGGPGTEDEKIEKSKTLAREALKKL